MLRQLDGLTRSATGWLCCALLLAATNARAQDDPPGRVGRLAALQGEVFVYDDELGEWQAAQRNRPLTQGDRLSTAADGRVELRVGSTTLHLGGSAELDVMRLDDDRMQFALLRGSLALRVRSQEVAAELEVLSPEGRFVPLRSGLYRVDRQDEISSAAVWRGELQFQAPDLSRTLQPGQRAEFWRDGPQRIARSQWLAPLDDAFAQAVLRDDQADTRSAATVFVSPEMTGVEDLDRFGGWQQHPDYGAVWTPSTVAVGWVPYRHGQWVWLRPWGWTWVDDAPWGFAPFHYGRWLSWGGRWCWAPGPRVARPVYAPALVAWAGGPRFNVVVGSRPVPAVGWVPLAPREHYRPGYRASPGYLNRLNAHPQLLGPPPTGYGNRHVPGAVTVVPSERMAPRQPVAAAALRAEQMALAHPWQAERFHFDAPGRPATPPRESARPRATGPFGGSLGGAAAPPAALGAAPAPGASHETRPLPPQPQPRPQHAQAEAAVRPVPPATRPLPNEQIARPVPPVQPAQPPQPVQGAQQPGQQVQPMPSARPRPGQPVQLAQPAAPLQNGQQIAGPAAAAAGAHIEPAAVAAPAAPAVQLPAQTSAAPQPRPLPLGMSSPSPSPSPSPAQAQAQAQAPQPARAANPAAPFSGHTSAPGMQATAPVARATAPAAATAAGPAPTAHAALPAPRAAMPVAAPVAGAQAAVAATPAAAPRPPPHATFAPPGSTVAAAPLAVPAATPPVAPQRAAIAPARIDPGTGGRDADAGDRRRTADSRQTQRER